MAQISVIVPLYNTERMLCRCLDSILAQTFSDFDLILVDDGSTDGSGALCDRYAREDRRIRVIHQKNSGVGVARNTGLDAALEREDIQWITFVDSDDWAHPKMLELLMDLVREYDVKISACGYLETQGENLPELPVQLETTVWEIPTFYTHQELLATVPWGKLYHRSCFREIRYPVGTYFDDEFVTYRLLFAQERIPMVMVPLYAYYCNLEGLTKRAWSPRKMDAWKAFEQQIDFFDARGDQAMARFRGRAYFTSIHEYIVAARSAPNADELKKEIRYMEKFKRKFIRRIWRRGWIQIYMDYEILCDSYPVLTRLHRIWLEKWKYGAWRKRR